MIHFPWFNSRFWSLYLCFKFFYSIVSKMKTNYTYIQKTLRLWFFPNLYVPKITQYFILHLSLDPFRLSRQSDVTLGPGLTSSLSSYWPTLCRIWGTPLLLPSRSEFPRNSVSTDSFSQYRGVLPRQGRHESTTDPCRVPFTTKPSLYRYLNFYSPTRERVYTRYMNLRRFT